MSEEQKRQLVNKLWGIANLLRGKISAEDCRDYILGFIFYKYLSERQYLHANGLLETEAEKDYMTLKEPDLLEVIKEESLQSLGYFLKPDELFASITSKGNTSTETDSNYILEDLKAMLNHIEQSTTGTDSEALRYTILKTSLPIR
jgi:type I restriction enzyme M protein